MTREEAIKNVKMFFEGMVISLPNGTKEAFNTLIPELRESDDERIRKALIWHLKADEDFVSNGVTKAECISYLEKQKEQKPSWSEEDEAHRDFILESLEDQIRFCKKDAEGAYCDKQIRTAQNWLKSIHERFGLQPKPECDNETEVQKAYREGKNAGRKEVFDHPEEYGLQLRRMYDYETGRRNPEWNGATMNGEPIPTENQSVDIPLAEWSEEDKHRLQQAINALDRNGYYVLVDWLKSLPERFGLQSKQKWSEEDENMLYQVLCYLDPTITREKREELESWLKSLLARFSLQPKQERNEEDEKVRKWLLEYFYLHRDDLRGASVTSMEVLSFLDNHPGNGKTCDVDEFTLALRNCLYADSELTHGQSDTFARAYGEELYKVAIGELKSGLDKEDIEEYRNELEFNPKPGEKFWVRCKTAKAENLWFDKGDERPAYAVDADGIITYIVHIKKDGTGNCVSYQDKEKFLDTFEIIKKPE